MVTVVIYVGGNSVSSKKIDELKELSRQIKDKKILSYPDKFKSKTMKVLCLTCNTEYTTSARDFLTRKNRGCPVCRFNHLYSREWSDESRNKLSNSKTKTNEKFLSQLGNEYEALEPYKGSHTKMKIRHKICGYEWEVMPYNKLYNSGCPACSCNASGNSRQEDDLYEYVRSIYSGEIIRHDKATLNGKYNQFGKELDIYIPEKKLAIEFNRNILALLYT